MCNDYWKLNSLTRKDHFPLPFLDQILERVAGHEFYCFLDGYSGFNQIAIALEYKRKPLSPVLLVLFHIVGCLLDYVMHLLHSNDACLVFLLTWLKDFLKFSWMIFLFLVTHLKIVYLT